MKKVSVFTALVAVSFSPAVFAAEEVTREQLLEEFRKIIPDGAMGRATTFETNGYKVESSVNKELGTDHDQGGKLGTTGNELKHLVVTSPDLFQVIVARSSRDGKSTGGGIGLFHRDTGEPMLSAGDTDGDGRIDVLAYSVFDDSGAYVLEVVDYEADGQADMRLHIKEKYFEIWHADRWWRTEKRGEQRGIVIDGKFVELQRGKNRWVVPHGV